MAKNDQKTVLIIGTNMMNLYHHRIDLINRLLQEKYKVVVAAPEGGEEKELLKIGCEFIPMAVDNRGTNIKNDLALIKNLTKIYRQLKPSVILTFYTKTNIYGGIVARYMKYPYIENICGLGTSLVGNRVLSKIMARMYKMALKNSSHVFFQNKFNISFMKEKKIYSGSHTLLPGSGVSLTRYNILPYPQSNNVEFLFCSRILKDKGIDEYLEAAVKIKKKYPNTIFHVAGPCEPSYVSKINDFNEKGIINYHGKLMNLHPILEKIHCTVLPSYYPEGMANILLESAASGRPIITTTLPGCGETVEDGVTGFTVKEKDSDSVAEAMEKFINLTQQEKEKMGEEGRKKMEREFDRNIITEQYLNHIQDIV